MQCLHDYDIPLYLSTTVTKVFGEERLEEVEISQVDEKMKPIPNTNKIIKCDALILSVGLIPENEIAEKIQVPLSNLTKGPIVDQTLQTMVPGVYSCGNALHVNNLADYVSESGEVEGLNAATSRVGSPEYVDLVIDEHFSYIVPEKLELNSSLKTILYFRSRAEYTNNIQYM